MWCQVAPSFGRSSSAFNRDLGVIRDLAESVTDHRTHGNATEPGYQLTGACPCRVMFERWVTPWMPNWICSKLRR